MNIQEVPFNKYLGFKDDLDSGNGFVMEDEPIYRNHVGTVHAAALFALAEAASGLFLNDIFAEIEEEAIVPVVKKATAQYTRPVTGRAVARNMLGKDAKEQIVEELRTCGRSNVIVPVPILDDDGEQCFLGEFEWVLKIRATSS